MAARKWRADAAPAVSGWLVIDKPAGMTSTAVVNRVRYLANGVKTGHAGTLDPLATGVLPIALGEATKTVAYAVEGTKTYRFTVRWGEARNTDDADGEVTEASDRRPSEPEIRRALKAFIGEIDQIPPVFSAVKVAGERAYKLARADKEVRLEPRRVQIHRFELVEIVDADHANFEVECGKGAYMRSLARDLASALDTVGHIAVLRRTAVGGFTEADAISLDNLEALGHISPLLEHLLSVQTALDDIPALAMTGSEAARLRRGQAVPMFRTTDLARIGDIADGATVCAMADGKLVALARLEGGKVHPVRVLNL